MEPALLISIVVVILLIATFVSFVTNRGDGEDDE